MDADEIRAALTAMRQHDLPTHGGRTLAYVYDSGLAEADAIWAGRRWPRTGRRTPSTRPPFPRCCGWSRT